MTAPDKIWAWAYKGRARGGGWSHSAVGHADAEYTRSDLIPAMRAEARAEALREAYAKIEAMWASTTREHMDAILALLDTPAPTPAQPSVQEAAKEVIDAMDAVDAEAERAEKPGATAWSSAPVVRLSYAREGLRRALASEDQT